MADFVAILKKTIGSLGENSPEMREKVYDKARATIEAKLAAIDPPPPPVVAERQKKALEDAIAVVRAEYDAIDEDEGDPELESLFASMEQGTVLPDPDPAGQPSPQPLIPPAPSSIPAPRDAVPVEPTAPAHDPFVAGTASGIASQEADEPDFVEAVLPALPANDMARPAPRQKRRSGSRGLTVGLVAAMLLIVFAGGGYALWMNRADLAGLLGGVVATTETPAPARDAPAEAEPAPDEAAADEPASVEQETASAEPDPVPVAEAEREVAALDSATPTRVEPEKFTQRLMPDGSEVDEGPADGPRRIGEGTSMAAVVPPEGGDTATDAAGQDVAEEGEAGEAAPGQASTPTIPVGQRAIFYEERTSVSEGSAELGSIVWSLVQESPGGDLPPEAAIRAEVMIPARDLQLRMTIRRNGDDTLPAGHIIEIIFLTPEGFEGGGISSVSRVTFKESEQAAGNPLLGIPAKIADGFFLVALSDNAPEMEANMTLMRRQSWIDIPLLYESGRRALVTLEKGLPGDRVFQEALRAWSEATSG